jgi:3-phenylpropionate/cinnamic acid dioxygenase small subunit
MNAVLGDDLKSAAAAFLVEEARLLDAGRFEEWLALFAEDGFYWLPAAPGQADPLNHLSIFYEDKSVLRMRVRRLAHPRVYSAQPAPRTAHMIGGITVAPAAEAGADCECRSTVMVAEYRASSGHSDRRLWAGQQLHRLRRTPEGLRIVLKRIDLIDSDAAHGILSVPI